MEQTDWIIGEDDTVLVTGATGFIGAKVVGRLLEMGFLKVRCLVRPTADLKRLNQVIADCGGAARVEMVFGNLLSREDCLSAVQDAAVIYHLAVGAGTKSFPDAFMNSVVTTRNLLDASLQDTCLKRFVNVSSFTVYTNREKPRAGVLDEDCPVEDHSELRGEAYCFAKVKQDELVIEYGKQHEIPYVILRPGVVYGPGKTGLIGRVGTDTFGPFLHLGGSNTVPLTYVDNCAEAVVLAGVREGTDGEVFNIVDDDLPSSRQILRGYKQNVERFTSVYVPHAVSYLLHYLWEKYSDWSQGQLPPAFNRRSWHVYWKKTRYTNEKLKRLLGWIQRVPTAEGLARYFESCRGGAKHA